MADQKSYTTPVWWIGAITFLEAILLLVFWWGLQDFRTKDNDIAAEITYRFMMKQLGSLVVTLAILLAEVFAYWIIRKLIVRKFLTWIHIIGLLLAFVVLPIVFVFFKASLKLDPDIRGTLHWTFLIVGHSCFVLVLIDVFKKRNKERETPAPDSPDLLNDYA